jgi:hypothetical protein
LKYVFLLFLLFYPQYVSANLSEKISVKVALPLSLNSAKTKSNELQARLIAKNNIIKKYLKKYIQLPKKYRRISQKISF